jgi:hypothetical protein
VGCRISRINGSPLPELWPSAIAEELEGLAKERFEALQAAMHQYFHGVPVDQIQESTGVSRYQLPRLARKCLAPASDGRIQGFRALLPYRRTEPYCRTAGEAPKRSEQQGGQTGLFKALLAQYPDAEPYLVRLIRQAGKRNNIAPQKLRPKDLHQAFIEFLRSQNAPLNKWPFTAKHKGKRSIAAYMRSVLDKNFSESVRNWEDRAAKAHLSVGTGINAFLVCEEPYDIVEIDAYHIDCHTTVAFETPEGTETDVLIERLWLIAAVERHATAVLAYTVVYRSEVTADDVLRVIRKAATGKWEPMEITVSGLQYGNGAGLPSGLIEECFGAQWSITMLDGALAHLALAVRERARKTLGFSINWGPVGHFERRPNVEHTFSEIAKNVFHRLPSTTGSNPFNGRAPNAEDKAIRYKIRAEDVEPLTDIYFAQHNATPSEGQYNLSPLEVLAYYLEGKNAVSSPRKLPKVAFEAAKTLACREIVTVRGGRKTGRRPYIQIDRVHYTSPLLAGAGQLVGTKLLIDIDEEDMRQVRAFLENGEELGYLTAQGMWSVTKHSRRTRKAINSLLYRRILKLSEFDDPILKYLAHLSTLKNEKGGSQNSVLPAKQATDAARVANEAAAPLKIHKPRTAPAPKSIKDVVSNLSLDESPIPAIPKVRNRK